MSLPSLLFFLRGYVTITVSGHFPERFLNVCTQKNILLWDIVRVSEKTVRCRITARGFKKLIPISYRTSVHIHIIAKHGFPFLLYRYKKRKLLLLGTLLFFLFMIIINQFVWAIEIKGNHMVKTTEILRVLEEEGVKIGTPLSKIDQQHLKHRALLKLPKLSWLWVDKSGSKLIVDVREGLPVPDIHDASLYCNVKAAKDGIIDSMIVKNGIPVVKEGDTVLKGMVLVTGKIPASLKPEIRYVHADAQIFARVWYEKTQRFSRLAQTRTETGKQKKHYTLTLFGKNIPLFHNGKAPFPEFSETTNKTDVSFFGRYLGITLSKTVYREVTITEERLTLESTVSNGVNHLKSQIDQEARINSTPVSFSHDFKEVDDTTVEVIVTAEYIEDIAEKEQGEIINQETPET